MIGVIVVNAVMGEHIDMCSSPRFGDPFCPAFPMSSSGCDVEDRFARLVCTPRLSRRRLLHLQPQAVSPHKIPSGIVRTAPIPFRLQCKRYDSLGHLTSQDVGHKRFSERRFRNLGDHFSNTECRYRRTILL